MNNEASTRWLDLVHWVFSPVHWRCWLAGRIFVCPHCPATVLVHVSGSVLGTRPDSTQPRVTAEQRQLNNRKYSIVVIISALSLLVGHWACKNEWWGVGVVVICLEQGADCLHIVQLMPLHPKTPSSLASFKSRLVFAFLVLSCPVCPGKEAVKLM